MNKLPEEIRQAAIARWKKGEEECLDIALDLGCSVRALCNWTRGLRRDRNYHRHSERTRLRAIHLYVEKFYSGSEVADILGDNLSKATVLRWVQEAGHSVRPVGHTPKNLQRQEILRNETSPRTPS